MERQMIFHVLVWTLMQYLCQVYTMCPLKENIHPCTCNTDKDDMSSVTCDSLTSAKLQTITKRMKGYDIAFFLLLKSNVGDLPADVFRGIKIESLAIRSSNLTSLSDKVNKPPFLGLENSLRTLEIQDGFTNDKLPLYKTTFSHLKNLDMLQLKGNIIPTISNDWFQSGPYRLQELHFLDSNTKTIGDYAFNSLVFLEKFSITGGSISRFSRDMLPHPAYKLEYLNFNDNQLTYLPEDMFKYMPQLKEIHLEKNDLTTIPEITFAPVWGQLMEAQFNGSLIICDGSIRWIFKYRRPQFFSGMCEFPGKKGTRDMAKLTLTEFDKLQEKTV